MISGLYNVTSETKSNFFHLMSKFCLKKGIQSGILKLKALYASGTKT